MLSFIVLINPPVHLIFGQEETSQTGQQGESSSSSKEQSKQQEKIRCSNGSIVDTPSECPLSNICPSTPQLGNGTIECNSNSITTNESTNNVSNSGETLLNEVGNQGQFQAIDITTDKRYIRTWRSSQHNYKEYRHSTIDFSERSFGTKN